MVYSFLLFFVFPIFFSILFSKMIMSHLWSYRPKERFSHFGFRQSIDCLTFFFCFFLGFLWFTQETNKVIKHILCFKQTNRKKRKKSFQKNENSKQNFSLSKMQWNSFEQKTETKTICKSLKFYRLFFYFFISLFVFFRKKEANLTPNQPNCWIYFTREKIAFFGQK